MTEPLPDVKLRALANFPVSVTGRTGINVVKINGRWYIDYDVSGLVQNTNIPVDQVDQYWFTVWNEQTNSYVNVPYSLAATAGVSSLDGKTGALDIGIGLKTTGDTLEADPNTLTVASPSITNPTFRSLTERFKYLPTLYDFGFTPNAYGVNNEQKFADLIADADTYEWARHVIVPQGNWVVEDWPGFITSPLSFTGFNSETCVFYPDFVPAQVNWGLFTYSGGSTGARLEDFGIIRQSTHGLGGTNISFICPTNVAIGRFVLRGLYLSTASNALNYNIFSDGSANNSAAPSVRNLTIDSCTIFGATNFAVACTRTNGIGITNTSITTAGGTNGYLYIDGDGVLDTENHNINLLAAAGIQINRTTNCFVAAGQVIDLLVGSGTTNTRIVSGNPPSGIYQDNSVAGSGVSIENGLTGTTKGPDAANTVTYLPNRRVRKTMTFTATTSFADYAWATYLGASDVPFTSAPTVTSCFAISVGALESANISTATTLVVPVIASHAMAVRVTAEGPY